MYLKIGQKMRLAQSHAVTELGKRVPSYTTFPCKVVYINFKHRWFTVEFDFKGNIIRESYKFSFPGWVANPDEMIIWHGGIGCG